MKHAGRVQNFTFQSREDDVLASVLEYSLILAMTTIAIAAAGFMLGNQIIYPL